MESNILLAIQTGKYINLKGILVWKGAYSEVGNVAHS